MSEEQNAYTVSYDELSIALKRYCDTWFEKHDHAQWEDTYKRRRLALLQVRGNR